MIGYSKYVVASIRRERLISGAAKWRYFPYSFALSSSSLPYIQSEIRKKDCSKCTLYSGLNQKDDP